MHMVTSHTRDTSVIQQWSKVEMHQETQHTKAYFQLMEFAVPLTCVPVESIKFVVCKFLPEEASSKVIGIAQDDELLRQKLWPRSNK